jgi:Domain of unknown function (DUF4390)
LNTTKIRGCEVIAWCVGASATVRVLRSLASSLVAVWLSVLSVSPIYAQEQIDLKQATLNLSADQTQWVIAADFTLNLSPAVEDAVSKGVVLYFVTEFELIRPRWYWRDERSVTSTMTYRLAYNALTRQYRVSVNGGFQTSYGTLAEALGSLTRLRGWAIADRDRIRSTDKYEAWLRLRLDTTQLPKPFQISAINNRDWNPQSEWKRFPFPAETPKNAQ